MIGFKSSFEVSMVWRPLVKIERIVEYVAIYQIHNFDPLLENCRQILQKEERACVIILVFDAVVDNLLNGLDLVISEGIVDCWTVVKFPLMSIN